MTVFFTDDPAEVLRRAGAFLTSEPVLHNLVLSLLHARVEYPEPGRYWVAERGVAFQSPLHYPATITPMRPEIAEEIVDAICEQGVALPGVNGEAGTAARFAGHWAERRKSAAVPIQGQRIYELIEARELAAPGAMRRATADDRELVTSWMRRFNEDVGEPAMNVDGLFDRRPFYLWEDGEPMAMVAHTLPVERVVRVHFVFTPQDKRRRGYAGACVAALSRQLHEAGLRCALYTDLGNPTSNSIYRRIGYRAVAEAMRYRFD